MNKKLLVCRLCTLLLFAAVALPSQASSPAGQTAQNASAAEQSLIDDDDAGSDTYWEAELGVLVGFNKSPMSSVDNNDNGEPFFGAILTAGYYNGNFFVESSPVAGRLMTFGYTALETDDLQLNLIATPAFLGFKESDQQSGNLLSGLDKRDTSFDAGIELVSSLPYGEFKLSLLHDITSTHKGYAFNAGYVYPLRINKFMIAPSIEISVISKKTVDYYYGIRVHEVRADRAFYQGSTGLVTKLGVYGEYQLSEDWTLIGFARYNFFNSGVSDSPLFTRDYRLTIAMGAVWTF